MKNIDKSEPTDDETRAALDGVLSSDAFVAAPRLRQFLSYVVEERAAGRGESIKGKSIAVDVYERSLDDDTSQNLVRVEARRLRRQLDQYYRGHGRNDPWRIVIDVGGYAPRFERQAPGSDVPLQPRPTGNRRPILFATGGIAAILVVAIVNLPRNAGSEDSGAARNSAVLGAMRQRSVQAVQAVNLAEQQRGMFFPLFDTRRQNLSLDAYRHVIELDPGLHHGYAGASQVLATLALVTPDADLADRYLAESRELATKAFDMSPDNAWSLGAYAWMLAVAGEVDEAIVHAQLAVKLAPDEGHVLDLAGITGIVANSAAFAAEVSDPDRQRRGEGRFGANNIWGTAQYMLGNYSTVVDVFSRAPEAGAPVSAPSLILLAAAHDHLEELTAARRYVDELNESWPNFPVEHVVSRFFYHAHDIRDDIIARLEENGYEPAR
jgi:tetratricopeptide (TPR) repeat protein